MSTIVTIGTDLAKNVFTVHGVDASGKAVLIRPSVARGKLLELIAKLTPCLIGMEACSGVHHWARESQEFGRMGSDAVKHGLNRVALEPHKFK